MFRKRNRTPLEQSLKDIGVDLHGDLGKILLKRLIECGHSERSIVISDQWSVGYEFAEFGGDRELLASADLSNEVAGYWNVYAWEKGDYGDDLNAREVYSEYDLFGNRIEDV